MVSDGRRRYLIALGTSRYIEEEFNILPNVPTNLRRIVCLFTERLGYQRILTELGDNGLNASSDQIRDMVNSWFSQKERTAEDIIVFYYTGHGYVDEHNDHYLWTYNSILRNLQGTSIETANLGKWFLTSSQNRPQNVWIILDTCYAGQGSGTTAAVINGLKQSPLLGEQSGFWVFATSGAYDEAEQEIFTQALVESIDELGKSQQSQIYLSPLDIKNRINNWFESHERVQRVQADIAGNVGKPLFIRNPYCNYLKLKETDLYSIHTEPVMNLTQELAAFWRIALGQDTQTRLILVSGDSGMGKTYLFGLYKQIADANSLSILDFNLGPQISIAQCIDQIVSHFGHQLFPSYDEFQSSSLNMSMNYSIEREWHRNITRKFFIDLSNIEKKSLLVIFFDQYEKADIAFKNWLTQVFLPSISIHYPIMVVIAGQEKFELPASRKGYHHFSLMGVSVDWFHRYAKNYKVDLEYELINEFHTLLHGRPKDFVDYIKVRSTLGDMQ